MLLLAQVLQHLLGARLQVVFFEQELFGVNVEVGVACDEVQQKRVGLDVLDRNLGFGGNIWAFLDDFQRKLADGGHQRSELRIALSRHGFVEVLHPHSVVGLVGQQLQDAKPALSLQNRCDVAVGHAEGLDHLHQGPHRMQVVGRRRFGVGVALGDHPKEFFTFLGVLNQANRLVASGRDWADHARELHGVAQRQEGQLEGQICLGDRIVFFVGNERNKVGVLREE